MTVVTNPACTPDSPETVTPSDDEELNLEDEEEEQEETIVCRDYLITPPSPSNKLSYDYYNSKLRCDVEFLAGFPGDQWRFPGHRAPLSMYNTGMRDLLGSDKSDVVVVDYVDRRGFEQLLRYLYIEPNRMDSVSVRTARCTLDAAYKFVCPHLVERAVKRLDKALEPGVALDLLPDLRYMCTMLPGTPSAPTLEEDELTTVLMAHCSSWCDKLAHNALLVIDDNADETLRDARFEELSYEELSLIVRRDTLRVSSEMVLVEALSRWATATCRKFNKEATPANKRTALGELAYCPRYLLLDPGAELDRALAFELLEPMERKLVIARARKLSAPVPVGTAQENMLLEWAKRRPKEPSALPVTLGPRSVSKPESPRRRWCFSSRKRIKAPDLEPPKFDAPQTSKESCCTCFGNGILRAFICLFD